MFHPLWLPRHFSREECRVLRDRAAQQAFEPAQVAGGAGYARSGSVAWISLRSDPVRLFDRLEQLGRKYARSIGFEVTGIGEAVQIARYGPGDHFDWHVDVGRDERRRKISVVVQLSPARDYVGGDLEFCTLEASIYHRAIGSALVFPSILGHRVSPVRSGERVAAVAWLHGPPLR